MKNLRDRNLTNLQVAKLLRAVSAAYEIKGDNRFKVVAYDEAATAIEHSTSEAKDLWDDDNLKSIPGVGESIAKHLDELFRTGKVKHFDHVLKGLPPAMFELLDVPGIGPKTAYKLTRALKIQEAKDALSRLKKAAEQGKIRRIEGFGEQSEKEILEHLREYKPASTRMLLPVAWELSQNLVNYMKKEKAVERIDPLGSLRRMVSTVGDIDLSVLTSEPGKVLKKFTNYPLVREAVAMGKNTARVILKNGMQIDLKTQKEEAYGALLQHFTGSKQHNIHLRELALKKGMSLSEYGILVKKGKKSETKKFSDEKGFYQFLGMEYIPPELREDNGEIEAALQGGLPKLVELTDIKGDLHVHSDFPIEPSHDLGVSSMKEMGKKAIDLGYEYLGFSEHNPSTSKHQDKQVLELLKRKSEAIAKLNYSIKENTQNNNFILLNGLEVDIKPNGKLALPEEAFKMLDYVIVSIHSSFDMDQKEMTRRVLRGLSHPKAVIFGHPTGRKLGEREGYELDWDEILAFCKKENKYLEINAWPSRLDLPDSLVKTAVKMDVKMVINTDCHLVDQLDNIFYGVSVARRGWAKKEDIINTLPVKQLSDIIKL